MSDTTVVRQAGNLTYKAQVLPGGITDRPFDGYALRLIRYRGQNLQEVESHYWALVPAGPRWIEYDVKKFEPITQIQVFSLDWPRMAYEIATHVEEAEAREALEVGPYARWRG